MAGTSERGSGKDVSSLFRAGRTGKRKIPSGTKNPKGVHVDWVDGVKAGRDSVDYTKRRK
jgi:hypothetical protein